MTRFKGSMTTDKSVETPVMVTLSAKSALNKEHHPLFGCKNNRFWKWRWHRCKNWFQAMNVQQTSNKGKRDESNCRSKFIVFKKYKWSEEDKLHDFRLVSMQFCRISRGETHRNQLLWRHDYSQFEYDPPGEDVTTSNVTPIASSIFSIFTMQNPTNGRKINWSVNPIIKAFQFRNCFRIWPMSTVADIPKTKKKRRMWAPISVAWPILLS